MNFDKDYYGILEVLPSAEMFLIKAAYKALAQKYHPDKHQKSEQRRAEAEIKMKALNEAYAVLSDANNRKQYDEYLEQNNQQNKYSEEDSSQTSSSESINEKEWRMAVEYVPELQKLHDNLHKISPNLAFNFKLKVLRDKAFNTAEETATELEDSFFTTFFGDNPDLIYFARFLLTEHHRDAAQELNRAIKLFGANSEANKIIRTICLKYNIDIEDEEKPYEPWEDDSYRAEPTSYWVNGVPLHDTVWSLIVIVALLLNFYYG